MYLLQSLKESKELSVYSMAKLLDVNPSNVYYNKKYDLYIPLKVMNVIDRIHTDHPEWGFRHMAQELISMGYQVPEYKIKNLMSEMAIHAVYSDLNNTCDITEYPYLLNANVIDRPNKAWYVGLSYIRLKYGFAFLSIVMDYYSFYVIEWYINKILGTDLVLEPLKNSLKVSVPEIVNSNQGIPFNDAYIEFLSEHNIPISMNNKYRWTNDFVDDWFRNLKYNEIYNNDYDDIKHAKKRINDYIKRYNSEPIPALNGNTPADIYSKR